MRWEDERYVRLYTRDSADWMVLSWDAQALLMQLFRKVDRAGGLRLGRHGKKGVAIVLGRMGDWERIAPALEELLADGCVCVSGEHLFIPNFLAAQEAVTSDAQRKRDQREREQARLLAAAELVTQRDIESRNVTKSHEPSRAVTSGHSSLTVPNRTEPAGDAEIAPIDPVRSAGALNVPAINARATPGRRREDHPPPVEENLREALERIWLEETGVPYVWQFQDDNATRDLLAQHSREAIERVWRQAATCPFPKCIGVGSLVGKNWNAFANTAAAKKPKPEAAEVQPLKHLG